jgi:hypothetical protein
MGYVVGICGRQTLAADLVVRSVGYRGLPPLGVLFDERTCRVPHAVGRVIRVNRAVWKVSLHRVSAGNVYSLTCTRHESRPGVRQCRGQRATESGHALDPAPGLNQFSRVCLLFARALRRAGGYAST